MTERTRSIKIRVTNDEYDRLERLKSGSRLATWIRETCLGEAEQRECEMPTVSPVLLRQIAGIGNNLNQIARKVNSNEWSVSHAVQIIAELRVIEKHLSELRGDFDS